MYFNTSIVGNRHRFDVLESLDCREYILPYFTQVTITHSATVIAKGIG